MRRPPVARAAATFAVLVALLAVSLGGCFDEVQLPAELEDQVVTIRFWHAMAGELGDAMMELVKRFHETHPGIRVVPIYQGSYAALSQKIVGSVMAHEPPNLAQTYPSWISFLNQDGDKPAVLSLDERIAADPDFRPEEIFPALLDDCRIGGKLFSLPFNKSFPVLYYNRDMLRAAGFPAPPATWADFERAAKAMTVDRDGDGRPEQWGWAFNIDSWIYETCVLQRGGGLIADDGLTALFDQPPALEALQFFVDAAHGPQPFAYQVTGYDHQMDFCDQKVAMMITSSVSRLFMKDRLRFDYGMAPLPAGTRRAAILSGTNLSMFATGDEARRKASWEFIKFFCSAQATAYWSMRTNYVPVRTTGLALMKDYLAQDTNAGAAISQLDCIYYEPIMPAWYECRQVINGVMEKTLNERGGARERLAAANAEMALKLARGAAAGAPARTR